MNRNSEVFRRLTLVCVLTGTLAIALAVHYAAATPSIFLSTHSPGRTYTVNLTGRKERPFFFTNEVRFHVLKHGIPFASEQYLHSGDSFDLSFESGFPDHRWVSENVLHFYRKKKFHGGEPENLIISNKSNTAVKHLTVYSVDKFILFDLQPGSEARLSASPARGHVREWSIRGEFVGGQSFENGASFKIGKEAVGPHTYYVSITSDGLTFESPELEKYPRAE